MAATVLRVIICRPGPGTPAAGRASQPPGKPARPAKKPAQQHSTHAASGVTPRCRGVRGAAQPPAHSRLRRRELWLSHRRLFRSPAPRVTPLRPGTAAPNLGASLPYRKSLNYHTAASLLDLRRDLGGVPAPVPPVPAIGIPWPSRPLPRAPRGISDRHQAPSTWKPRCCSRRTDTRTLPRRKKRLDGDASLDTTSYSTVSCPHAAEDRATPDCDPSAAVCREQGDGGSFC